MKKFKPFAFALCLMALFAFALDVIPSQSFGQTPDPTTAAVDPLQQATDLATQSKGNTDQLLAIIKNLSDQNNTLKNQVADLGVKNAEMQQQIKDAQDTVASATNMINDAITVVSSVKSWMPSIGSTQAVLDAINNFLTKYSSPQPLTTSLSKKVVSPTKNPCPPCPDKDKTVQKK